MSATTELESLIAQIATSGENATITSVDFLTAVRRAVYGGYAIGAAAGSAHMAKAIELVFIPNPLQEHP